MSEVLARLEGSAKGVKELGLISFTNGETNLGNNTYKTVTVTLPSAIGFNNVAIGSPIADFRMLNTGGQGVQQPRGVTISLESTTGKISITSPVDNVGFLTGYFPKVPLIVW